MTGDARDEITHPEKMKDDDGDAPQNSVFPLADIEKVVASAMVNALREMKEQLKREIVDEIVPQVQSALVEMAALAKAVEKRIETVMNGITTMADKNANDCQVLLRTVTQQGNRMDRISREQEGLRKAVDDLRTTINSRTGMGAGVAATPVIYPGGGETYKSTYARSASPYPQRAGFTPIPTRVYDGSAKAAGRVGKATGRENFLNRQGPERSDAPRLPTFYQSGFIPPIPFETVDSPEETDPSRQWTTRGDGIYTSEDSDDGGGDEASGKRSSEPSIRTKLSDGVGVKPGRIEDIDAKISASLSKMAPKVANNATTVNSGSGVETGGPASRTGSGAALSGGFGGGRRGSRQVSRVQAPSDRQLNAEASTTMSSGGAPSPDDPLSMVLTAAKRSLSPDEMKVFGLVMSNKPS